MENRLDVKSPDFGFGQTGDPINSQQRPCASSPQRRIFRGFEYIDPYNRVAHDSPAFQYRPIGGSDMRLSWGALNG